MPKSYPLLDLPDQEPSKTQSTLGTVLAIYYILNEPRQTNTIQSHQIFPQIRVRSLSAAQLACTRLAIAQIYPIRYTHFMLHKYWISSAQCKHLQ